MTGLCLAPKSEPAGGGPCAPRRCVQVLTPRPYLGLGLCRRNGVEGHHAALAWALTQRRVSLQRDNRHGWKEKGAEEDGCSTSQGMRGKLEEGPPTHRASESVALPMSGIFTVLAPEPWKQPLLFLAAVILCQQA